MSLFNIWDVEKRGSILVKDIVRDFVSLGLAPNANSLYKVIAVIKGCEFKDVSAMDFSKNEF